MKSAAEKIATVGRLKDHLSEYLSFVRQGGQVTVYLRDKPVATIVPYEAPVPHSDDEWVADLKRRGIATGGSGRVPKGSIQQVGGETLGILDALLEERRQGR